jgi:hypothetical protein
VSACFFFRVQVRKVETVRRLTKQEQSKLREYLRDEDAQQLSEDYAGVCTCCGIVSSVEPDTCDTHFQFTRGTAENCAGIVFGIEQLLLEYPEVFPDSAEDREPTITELIGQAILGDDEGRATAERRAGIKAAVMRMMQCECGSILDQRSAALVTVQGIATGGRKSAIVCKSCKPRMEQIAERTHEQKPGLFRTTIETWNDSTVIG